MRKALKVGVGIPVYNEIKYIEACLASLNNQTHPVHIYLADDQSDDGTYKFLKDRPGWYHGLTRMPQRSGWPVSLNTAMKMAIDDGCDAVIPYQGDDMMRLDAVQKLVEALPGNDWATSYGQQVGGENVVQTPLATFPLTLDDFGGTHCPLGVFALIRSDVWRDLGGFSTDVSLPRSYGYNEDWEFWIKAMKAEYKGGLVKEPLTYYVMRDKQLHRVGLSRHAEARAGYMAKHPDVFKPEQWTYCGCGCTPDINPRSSG